MKRFFICIVLLLVASVGMAETITWNNTTGWTDNTAMSQAEMDSIVTKLYYGSTAPDCQAAGSSFASVSNGLESWTGTLPVTQKGSTTYYCATNTVPISGNVEGGKSNAVAYTVPFVAPGLPSLINISK